MNSSEKITPIEHRTRITDWIVSLYVKNYKVINKKAMVPKGNKRQVSFYSHGNLFSWLVVPPIWAKTLCEEGFPDYRSSILFHPIVHKVPLVRTIGSFMSGGYRAVSPKDAIYALNKGLISHFGTMPEASNCLYRYDEPIGPFKYNGLISIGLATHSNFLLVVHKGTEAWNKDVRFPISFGGRKGLFVPLPLKRLENVVVHFSTYKPKLKWSEIKNVSKQERRRLEDIEGQRMRKRMLEIYDSL